MTKNNHKLNENCRSVIRACLNIVEENGDTYVAIHKDDDIECVVLVSIIRTYPILSVVVADRILFAQENADAMFNSSLLFELAVMKDYAQPILSAVPHDCPEYAEAHRLLRFLGYFQSINQREIPPTSLLREFLGGSSFKY